MSIFDKRENIKPYEYPELLKYKDAIRQSYWIAEEFMSEMLSDVQDFKTVLSDSDRQIISRTMMAISQVEVNVKKFWADIYNFMPKPEIGSVGYTFAECHAEGTEVLTPKGWKNLKDIKTNEDVIQFTKDGKLESTKVIATTKKYYEGKMHHLKKQAFEALITPNHKICYYKKNKPDIILEEIQNVSLSNTSNFWPEAAEKNGEVDVLTNKERLYIAIQADGSQRFYKKNGENVPRGLKSDCYTYDIMVKLDRKKERLIYLLEKCDFVYRKQNTSREGYVKYSVDIPNDFNYKKFDWVDLKNKSSKWCKLFVEELSKWDGSVLDTKNCHFSYVTTDKDNADMVQAIGVCGGYRCNLGIHKDDRKDSYKDCYPICFIENKEKVSFGPRKSDIIDYKGNVYCISVPSKMIVTRYKNKVFISGNSEVRHMDAYSEVIGLLGLNEEFEQICNVGAIKDRMDYFKKYQHGTKVSQEKYTKSIFLFSLFVENVSLFGQFLIMLSYKKYKNQLKGISNAVAATCQEEILHGQFGMTLINIIKEEFPEYFNDEFKTNINKFIKKAFKAELKILDWIFESGELDCLPKKDIEEFMKNRFNESLESVGFEKEFEIDEDVLAKTRWFDEEIYSSKHDDFFNTRPTSYSKNNKSFTSEDLF